MSNIYKTPESEVSGPILISAELASRAARFFANFIDMTIVLVIVFGGLYFFGFYEIYDQNNPPDDLITVFIGVGMGVVFFLINFKFLVESGQTIGKKVLKIRIVSDGGEVANLQKHIIPRYMVYFFTGIVPVVGQLLSFVNVLFIFRSDRKCVHDLMARTKVVKC